MVIWLVWRGQWSLHGCRLSNTRIPGSAGDEDWDVCIQSGCSYTTIISEIWGSQTDWQELKTCPQLWGFSRAEHFRHISRTRSIGPYSAHAPGGATESWEFLILGGYIGYTGLYILTLYTLYCFTVYIYIFHCRNPDHLSFTAVVRSSGFLTWWGSCASLWRFFRHTSLTNLLCLLCSKARIAGIQIRLVAPRAEMLLTAATLHILSVGQSAVPSPVQVVTVLTLASPSWRGCAWVRPNMIKVEWIPCWQVANMSVERRGGAPVEPQQHNNIEDLQDVVGLLQCYGKQRSCCLRHNVYN